MGFRINDEIILNADGWELYRGRNKQARMLSKKLTVLLKSALRMRIGDIEHISCDNPDCVDIGCIARWVWREMHRMMFTDYMRDAGAADTEPQWVLLRQIEKALDLEHGNLGF
jgi:hypothetical protein